MTSSLEVLFRKYCDNTCSEAEREEFLSLARQEAYKPEIGRLIDALLSEGEKQFPFSEEAANNILQTIFVADKTVVFKPLAIVRQFRWAAAACALLIIGVAVYLIRVHNLPIRPNVATNTRQPNDVLPGGNKAFLTLADGRRVVLDSAPTGVLAQQGGTKIVHESSGLLAYHNEKPTAALSNTVTTPEGGQYRVILPDGTRVWLNAASAITFPSSFTGAYRDVSLQGEAYFEVSPAASRPFIVHAGQSLIQVLGTQFDISTYGDDPAQKLTLIEGSVRIKSGDKERQLYPGEQARVAANGDLSLAKLSDIDEVTAWKNGLFNFDHKDLYSAMREIARWYDVKVVYQGKIADRTLLGYLPRNTKLSTILSLLSQVHVHCRIEGRTIDIAP